MSLTLLLILFFTIIFYLTFTIKVIDIHRIRKNGILYFPGFLFLFTTMWFISYKTGLTPSLTEQKNITGGVLFLSGVSLLYIIFIVNDLIKQFKENSKKIIVGITLVLPFLISVLINPSGQTPGHLIINSFILFITYFRSFYPLKKRSYFTYKSFSVVCMLLVTSGVYFTKNILLTLFASAVLGALLPYLVISLINKDNILTGDTGRITLAYSLCYLLILVTYNIY